MTLWHWTCPLCPMRHALIAMQAATIARLQAQLAKLRRMHFGRSSERLASSNWRGGSGGAAGPYPTGRCRTGSTDNRGRCAQAGTSAAAGAPATRDGHPSHGLCLPVLWRRTPPSRRGRDRGDGLSAGLLQARPRTGREPIRDQQGAGPDPEGSTDLAQPCDRVELARERHVEGSMSGGPHRRASDRRADQRRARDAVTRPQQRAIPRRWIALSARRPSSRLRGGPGAGPRHSPSRRPASLGC
jgi:hypothetical protein